MTPIVVPQHTEKAMIPTQMEALRAALKPFADEFVNHEPWAKHYNVGDTLQIGNHVLVTMGDLRRAAEAYAALEKEMLDRPVENEPKRIMQTEFGKTGNCQSACLAMMLGCDLSEVPNFSAIEGSNAEKFAAQGKWLNERGLWLFNVAKWAGMPWPPPKGFFIAGGPSPRGFSHSVILKDGELWHDPHPDGTGILEVTDVDVLLPLNFQPTLSRPVVAEGWIKVDDAVRIAANGWLVPPDGGSPTDREMQICVDIAKHIRALSSTTTGAQKPYLQEVK